MSLQDARRVYAQQRTKLEQTGYIQFLRKRIEDVQANEPSLNKPTRAICLGLMHVAYTGHDALTAKTGVSQLITFEAMLEAFDIAPENVTIYDPFFNDLDRLFLRELGYIAPEWNAPAGFGTDTKPNLPVVEESTLVFAPGCAFSQIYRRNWSPKGLNSIVWVEGHLTGLTQIVGKESLKDRWEIVVCSKVAEALEPERRASLLAEKRPLPSYHSALHKDRSECSSDQFDRGQGCESYKQEKDGYHLDYSVNKLCWIPEERTEAMGDVFWKIEPMVVKVSREDFEEEQAVGLQPRL